MCAKNSRLKKTTDSAYLTVEMVREAASAFVAGWGLPPSARAKSYQKAADKISYHLRRNQQARKSHTKTTRNRLRALEIDVDMLPSCEPTDTS